MVVYTAPKNLQSDLSNIYKMLYMCNDIVGTHGPIYVNIGVYNHINGFFSEDHELYKVVKDGIKNNKDMYVISSGNDENHEITIEDVMVLFNKIARSKNIAKLFNSGRSYFFEGIKCDKNNVYHFMWGS
jgi:hypothetical protein